MSELIKITEKNGAKAVSARDLYYFLEISEGFNRWAERMFDYGFIENVDFQAVNIYVQASNGIGGTNKKDYLLTLDTAKEISMLQRTEKGKQARRYFIECEKKIQVNQIDFSNPDTVLMLAQNWKDEQQKRIQAEETIKSNAPLVTFATALQVSEHNILIGELAKILKQNNIDIGQNRLFEWLRDNGYLIKQGEQKNLPTQKALELDLFQVKTTTINNPDGSVRVTRTTKVTPKGQNYFINKFLKIKHI